MTIVKYEFVVEDELGEVYCLDFAVVDDKAKKWLAGVWQRMATSLEKAHSIVGRKAPEWIEWKVWEWCESKRAGYEPRSMHIGWCGDQVAGFLNVWPDFASPFETSKNVLYIEHIGAAPGNQKTELWGKRFRHVGRGLLAYAIKLSQDQGYDGRIGLHVANESALGFYRKIGQNRQLPLFHPEKTEILGPTPHGVRGDTTQIYLETTPEGAQDFLEENRRD